MTSPSLNVELFRRGDPLMVQQFLEVIRRHARRYVRTSAEAESVAAEAIAELFTKLARGEQPERVKVWVATAASNAARRALTLQRRNLLIYESELHSDTVQTTLAEILRCRELLEHIDRILRAMPERTQLAIVATAVDGRAIESVATELGVSSNTMRKDVHRARRKFQRELSDVERLDRLREFARGVRRAREAKSGHAETPAFARSRPRSAESSASSR